MIRTRNITKLQKALESDALFFSELMEDICEIRDQIEELDNLLFSLERELEPIVSRICAAESQQEAEDQTIYARNKPRPKSESKLSLFLF